MIRCDVRVWDRLEQDSRLFYDVPINGHYRVQQYLEDQYQAAYVYPHTRSHYNYIKFKEPRLETLFRLRYGDLI